MSLCDKGSLTLRQDEMSRQLYIIHLLKSDKIFNNYTIFISNTIAL